MIRHITIRSFDARTAQLARAKRWCRGNIATLSTLAAYLVCAVMRCAGGKNDFF
jgi:hypothetical protein